MEGEAQRQRALIWDGDRGYGYLPPNRARQAAMYGDAYFEEYLRRARTPMGEALTAARVAFVQGRLPPGATLVDVGIGSGQFVEAMAPLRPTRGFDVNPRGVAWLEARGAFLDPYRDRSDAMTLWDALEHVDEPEALLEGARSWVFCSLPIFASREHALRSRHYKPDEHLWYFTDRGLETFMSEVGFALEARSRVESELGRDGIGSFAFRRRGA